MAKLDRILALVHALSETNDGLTLDEMASQVGVNRRTAERMRDVIAQHFDVDEIVEDKRKRFVIRDSLRRAFTRPTPAEIAALQTEVHALQKAGQSDRASPLASLLAKVRSTFDDRERRRLEPDLDALARIQRSMVGPGPQAVVDPATMAAAQSAILAGTCLEFDYVAEDRAEPRWRRIIPFGLVHGPVTYLIGKMPDSDREPALYRLDRMSEVRLSDRLGCAPEDWNIDSWLSRSFGIWRDDPRDVVLLVRPEGAAKALNWRFHPSQMVSELGDGSLRISFTSGGLRELAEHLFQWAGDLVIEGPEELKHVMRARIALAEGMAK